jgi:DNA invertase Pin-like site-specific DNA recombinase
MLIGYARVSTNDQDAAAQVAALKGAGCERIYREKASGGRWERPELRRLLDQLRKGDVLVVWKLDRLSRSLRDVLTIMERIAEANAGFRSLTEAVDTTTPAGRMMMHMVGAFAEFERAMLRERTKAGLESARRNGRIGGRRPKLSRQQQGEITRMVSRGEKTAADAARLFKIHPATVSRLLSKARLVNDRERAPRSRSKKAALRQSF